MDGLLSDEGPIGRKNERATNGRKRGAKTAIIDRAHHKNISARMAVPLNLHFDLIGHARGTCKFGDLRFAQQRDEVMVWPPPITLKMIL